jgi:hypothetical protein
MNAEFKKYLLKVTKATNGKEVEVIQSLWSGYGKISRILLSDSEWQTVVVKCISLNPGTDHPRGWNTGLSHTRKVKSYEVETCWYEHWSKECSAHSRIPQYIGSFHQDENEWIVLEDLNDHFPARKDSLNVSEVKTCLTWLANFHMSFMGQEPVGLWDIGSYWHLATRPDEWALIENQELKVKAPLIDQKLNECSYKTIIHGDAKLANFCFSEDGKQLAAVDFQYVGGGCGMKDVAYFLSSCLSGEEIEAAELELLDYYFSELRKVFEDSPALIEINFEALEEEWRRMYPFACADFTRFLMGWMPTHQKVNDYNLKMLNQVLNSQPQSEG